MLTEYRTLDLLWTSLQRAISAGRWSVDTELFNECEVIRMLREVSA